MKKIKKIKRPRDLNGTELHVNDDGKWEQKENQIRLALSYEIS